LLAKSVAEAVKRLWPSGSVGTSMTRPCRLALNGQMLLP